MHVPVPVRVLEALSGSPAPAIVEEGDEEGAEDVMGITHDGEDDVALKGDVDSEGEVRRESWGEMRGEEVDRGED